MKEYISLFETTAAYNAAKDSLDLPNVAYCKDQSQMHYNPIDYSQNYLTTVALESGTISFNIKEAMETDMITSISYSADNGETWTTTNNTDGKSEDLVITVNVNEGDNILWKGDATQLGFTTGRQIIGSFFSSTCEFDVKGNIMSLLYSDEFKGETTIENDYEFAYLFSNCSNVLNAKNLSLPATTLATYCYASMFRNCTNLITTPELPATILDEACYDNMFNGCTSLITAPELSAEALAENCYRYMFKNCTSLIVAPELPATTLTYACYAFMFQGCTNLTTAPELSATTIAESCYNGMFYNCTNLTTAPALPATTLIQGCYGNMFLNCTSLTTAPELPAETLVPHCYDSTFYGCTSLNYIKAMFTTTPSDNYTQNWVSGVAASGTFVKNSTAQWNVVGTNGVPTGWTVETVSN